MQSATDKITSSPAGSNTRIIAFTELADGKHTVNGKTFTKSGSAFTLDGKTLNAKEIEKATRTLTEKIKAKPKAEEKPSDQSDKSEKSDESGNTALFSTVGDLETEQYADKTALHQTEAQKKATDELFLFRDLPRGFRLDNTSVTAVRQLLENNVASFPEKIKTGFVKFFESLVSFKPPKGMGTITAENFVTSATTAGLLRKDWESAYLTIGNNTLRVSHHNTSVETFEKHGEAKFYDITNLQKNNQKVRHVVKITTDSHGTNTLTGVGYPHQPSGNNNNVTQVQQNIKPSSAKNPEKSSNGAAF